MFIMIKVKLMNEAYNTVICKCGHYNKFIYADVKKLICRGCGHWVYRTPKIEFEEKIRMEIKNEKKK